MIRRFPLMIVVSGAVLALAACTAGGPSPEEAGDSRSTASTRHTPPTSRFDDLLARNLGDQALVDLLARLRDASEDQHLPAFESTLERAGSPGMSVGHPGIGSWGRRGVMGPQESITRARAAWAEWKP